MGQVIFKFRGGGGYSPTWKEGGGLNKIGVQIIAVIYPLCFAIIRIGFFFALLGDFH